MVDTDLPGFKKGKLLKKIGMHTQDTAELFFDDVRLEFLKLQKLLYLKAIVTPMRS